MLAVPTLRFVFVGVAVAFAGFNGLGYWLPSFWERQFDLSEGEAAALTGALALVATMVGFWIGGVLGDRWHRERPSGRIDLAAVTLLIGGALLAVSLAVGVLALQLPLMLCAAILIVVGHAEPDGSGRRRASRGAARHRLRAVHVPRRGQHRARPARRRHRLGPHRIVAHGAHRHGRCRASPARSCSLERAAPIWLTGSPITSAATHAVTN